MERCGWPAIPYDGQLLVTHQDALLMGGKVQAAAGFADHVRFVYPDFCERCVCKLCVEICSGQAITSGPDGIPVFDREKCVHCGACLWNCVAPLEDDPLRGNISFKAGAGGCIPRRIRQSAISGQHSANILTGTLLRRCREARVEG